MRHATIRALIAATIGLSLAGAAYAQAAPDRGLWTKPNYDATEKANQIDEATQRDLNTLHNAAIKALQAKDYPAAETKLNELVHRKPTTEDANFLMGLAQIGLGKWDEARPYLEAAVQKQPERPEPKTRLGLVYINLSNVDAAKRQRADLAGLDAACKKSCADSTWITDGLAQLDRALAAPPPPPPLALGTASAGLPIPSAPIAETENFNPANYNLVTFSDTADLYDLLTRDGRCAPKKLADPRQPCALILYRPDDVVPGGLSANFKPVFSVVSRKEIWAIHNKKLQKVAIEDLYFDVEDIIGQKQTTYRSVALVGNAENKANCDKGVPCLSSLVVQDMFNMYRNMPDSVVKVIWGGGMEDVGTTRIR